MGVSLFVTPRTIVAAGLVRHPPATYRRSPRRAAVARHRWYAAFAVVGVVAGGLLGLATAARLDLEPAGTAVPHHPI